MTALTQVISINRDKFISRDDLKSIVKLIQSNGMEVGHKLIGATEKKDEWVRLELLVFTKTGKAVATTYNTPNMSQFRDYTRLNFNSVLAMARKQRTK